MKKIQLCNLNYAKLTLKYDLAKSLHYSLLLPVSYICKYKKILVSIR